MNTNPKLTTRNLLSFWLPLEATWLMMATEGPFLAAIIARLVEPKLNLAAYGVAFSFALIIEAPIIMMLSASTALVRDAQSYRALRRFNAILNAAITVIMLVFIVPSIFDFVTLRLIGLPDEVARLTHAATIALLPWPAAIGFRRFYQGLLIRHGKTRRVAYGTVVRLISMCAVAIIGYRMQLDGALVGAFALSAGVSMELIASRIMARHSIRRFLAADPVATDDTLRMKSIARFYYPLALTSLLALGIQPMVTFFMGQAPHSLESLAVIPVINSLVFIFRTFGLSMQEVAIANFGERREHEALLRRFAIGLASAATAGIALITFTPLAQVWFGIVSGLTDELARFAIAPAQIQMLLPATAVLIHFQHATLVHAKHTKPITWATVIEVATIILVLVIAVIHFQIIGAIAASLALIVGRLGANAFLWRVARRV